MMKTSTKLVWWVLIFASGTTRIVDANGTCFWVKDLDWCQGTNDGPNGEKWAYRGALMGHCITSTNRSNEGAFGCAQGAGTALCKSQSFDNQPEGQQRCMPAVSDFPSSTTWLLQCITSTGTQNPECDQNEIQNASGMGCPECSEAALEGSEVQFTCRTATTEEQCREINPGGSGTFNSGSIPEDLIADADTSACSWQNISRSSELALLTSGLVSLVLLLEFSSF